MVCGQPAMVAPHVRTGEYRFGSPAHGRAYAAHPRYGRTDCNGRTQESEKKQQVEGKRTYRKKTDAIRLCADDVLTREKLSAYHDSYAEAMAKYSLQRGIRGSEARHTTTAQYYRDLKRQTGELEANVQQLQTERQQAEQKLDEVKQGIKSENWKPLRLRRKPHSWQRSVLF